MSTKSLEQQLLLDAQEAGFKVFNGTIHLPAACDVMDAFKAYSIIRENRAIEPLVQELELVKEHRNELASASFQLTAALCMIPEINIKGWCSHIARERVMDLVIKWRMRIDKASAAINKEQS